MTKFLINMQTEFHKELISVITSIRDERLEYSDLCKAFYILDYYYQDSKSSYPQFYFSVQYGHVIFINWPVWVKEYKLANPNIHIDIRSELIENDVELDEDMGDRKHRHTGVQPT